MMILKDSINLVFKEMFSYTTRQFIKSTFTGILPTTNKEKQLEQNITLWIKFM